MAPMILSILSLLLNIVLGVWLYLHIRRDGEDHRVLRAYANSLCRDVLESVKKYTSECESICIAKIKSAEKEVADNFKYHLDAQNLQLSKEIDDKNRALKKEMESMYSDLSLKITNALSEINPNFEAAKNAISQVNDLSTGLMNLFNYDPVTALRASRTERTGE